VREAAGGAGDLLHTLFRHLLAWNGRSDRTQTQYIALGLLSAFVTGQTQAADVPRDAQPDAARVTAAAPAANRRVAPAIPLRGLSIPLRMIHFG
jgi:hypothetical protein